MRKSTLLALSALVATVFTDCTPVHRTTSTHYLSTSVSTGGSFYATGTNLNATGNIGGNAKVAGVTPPVTYLDFGFISHPTTTGTYSIDGINIWASYQGSVSDTVGNSSVSGTYTITSVSPDVVGHFTFTRADGAICTGSFNYVIVP